MKELFASYLEHSPFARRVGVELTEMEADMAVVTMPFSEENTTFANVVHGGAMAALVDIASVAASWSGATEDGPSTGATVALSVNYLRAAKAADLVARATVTRRTRSVCFAHVDVTGEDGELIAHGIATYKFAGA